jgi:hypothetical protein
LLLVPAGYMVLEDLLRFSARVARGLPPADEEPAAEARVIPAPPGGT